LVIKIMQIKWKPAPRFLTGLFILVWLGTLSAQDFEKIAPRTPSFDLRPLEDWRPPSLIVPADQGSDKIIIPRLKGLVFISDLTHLDKSGETLDHGIHVAPELPLLRQEEFQKRMKVFLGRPTSIKRLNQIVQDTILYFRENDRPLVHVFMPEQRVTGGIVQLVVVRGRVGNIRTQGNRWFADKLLLSAVRLRSGDLISARSITEDVRYLNQNPFRRVEPVFTPGRDPGETDIVLKTEDRFPVRFFTGYEDTGNDLTGDERLLAGFNWGNAFMLGHQLNYQFTTDYDIQRLKAHSGSWLIPLPWRHQLSFFGGYAETEADPANQLIVLKGFSWQASTRYTVPLPDFRGFTHEWVGGFDYKQSNNNLEFGGAQVFSRTTDVVQWMSGYHATLHHTEGTTSFGFDYFLSPGYMTGRNTDFRFRETRAHTGADYHYGRITLDRLQRLPWDMSLVGRGTLQFASGNLLSSEQLGVGGATSVRGYEEREANGDEGFLFSTELRSPAFSLLRVAGLQRDYDRTQFLAFWDYGVARRILVLPGEDPGFALSSAGPGVRFNIAPWLSARADYGFQLRESEGTRRSSRWHIGITVSY
jgi:hemolysin activation/secretion protein